MANKFLWGTQIACKKAICGVTDALQDTRAHPFTPPQPIYAALSLKPAAQQPHIPPCPRKNSVTSVVKKEIPTREHLVYNPRSTHATLPLKPAA